MLTQDQRRYRRRGIGGSDVAAICGLSPFRRPIDVYLEKIAEGEPPTDSPTDSQRFGALLEPIVADEYQRRHDDKTVVGPFDTVEHPTRSWHLFSLDRVVLEPGAFEPYHRGAPPPPRELVDRILEIKTAGLGTFRGFGDDGSDELPEHILCQVAWYMSGLDVNRCDVAALLNTSDYREFHVERDRELEAYLLEQAEAFWFKVQAKSPPEPDGSDAFTKYVKGRARKTTGLVAKSNPEVEQLALRLRAARAARKALDLEESRLTQKLMLAIGDNDAVETDQGTFGFKHDKRGRPSYRDAFNALAAHAGIDPLLAESFVEDSRTQPPRRFNAPRAWREDAPLDLLSLITDRP
jgi:putative phage-type endonuclease